MKSTIPTGGMGAVAPMERSATEVKGQAHSGLVHVMGAAHIEQLAACPDKQDAAQSRGRNAKRSGVAR